MAVFVLLLALLATGSIAFTVGRAVNETRSAEARTSRAPNALPQQSGQLTPSPEPPWYVPYLEEERKAPVFDGELNGLRIGPSVNPRGLCTPGEVRHAPMDVAVGTPMEIQPQYLPPESNQYESVTSVCGDRVIGVFREYAIAPDSARFGGGRVSIARRTGGHEVPLQQAASRASAVSIMGRPAVAFRPLTPEGWGSSALVIAEPWGTTTLQAFGLPAEELQKIAEGLYR